MVLQAGWPIGYGHPGTRNVLGKKRGRSRPALQLGLLLEPADNARKALAYLDQSFELEPNFRDLVMDEPDFDPIRNNPDFLALTSVIV